MDRPISLQGAINAIKNADVCMAWNGEISAEDAADIAVRATKSSVVDSVEDLPSVQPEIIRCRDCKYWREHKYAKETKRYIPFCGFNAIYTKADDFCSRAERKENR